MPNVTPPSRAPNTIEATRVLDIDTLAELADLGALARALEPAVRHLAMRAHRVLGDVDAVAVAFAHSDAECETLHRESGYFGLLDAILALDQHVSAVYPLRSDGRPDWLEVGHR